MDFDNIIKEAKVEVEAETAEGEPFQSFSKVLAALPIAISPYSNINGQTNVNPLVTIQITKEEKEEEEVLLTLSLSRKFIFSLNIEGTTKV